MNETALEAQIRVTIESVLDAIETAAKAEAEANSASREFWAAVKEIPELQSMHENWCNLKNATYAAERRANEARARLTKSIEVTK